MENRRTAGPWTVAALGLAMVFASGLCLDSANRSIDRLYWVRQLERQLEGVTATGPIAQLFLLAKQYELSEGLKDLGRTEFSRNLAVVGLLVGGLVVALSVARGVGVLKWSGNSKGMASLPDSAEWRRRAKWLQTKWEKSRPHASPDIGEHVDWSLVARDAAERTVRKVVLRFRDELTGAVKKSDHIRARVSRRDEDEP